MIRKTYKGKFKPQNLHKYKGDPTNIIYRSMWERNVMSYLDKNESVLEWGSEEIIIPYISPWDKRPHRYFPDFYAKLQTKDGTIKEVIIEVKPYKQTQKPKKPKKMNNRFLHEVATWGVNQAKWRAAEIFCEANNMEFQIITEKDMELNK